MNIDEVAKQLADRVRVLARPDTASIRAVRREFSKLLKNAEPHQVIELAQKLISRHRIPHFVGYELIQGHKQASLLLNENHLAEFSSDLNSWWTVDAFASYLSGVAWRNRQISDEVIENWARSDNVWLRRAALVSTVPLNNKSRGGGGDAKRTLEICSMLIEDREDMVVKAMSWALRELAKRDPKAVEIFLSENKERLARRVVREVTSKLLTGLKNPRHAQRGNQR